MNNLISAYSYAGNEPILLREALGDNGSWSCRSCSPDIIVQKVKLFDAKTHLVNTYDQDISENTDGLETHYLYVRCRNVSGQRLENIYIHLYRNHFGLDQYPNDWSKFEMLTETGKPVKIDRLESGEIGVSPAFLYDNRQMGSHPNCFVAVATQDKNPDFSWIRNGEHYRRWIDQRNVAARNVALLSVDSEYKEGLIHIKNNYDYDIMCNIVVMVIKEAMTPGVKYGFSHPELGIKMETIYDPKNDSTISLSVKRRLPSHFDSQLTVWTKGPLDANRGLKIKQYDIVPKGDIACSCQLPAGICIDDVSFQEEGPYSFYLIGECDLIYTV